MIQRNGVAAALLVPILFLACSASRQEDLSSGQPARAPWPVPPEAEEAKNPLAELPPAAKQGEAVFNQQCAVCHGTGGKGNGPDASRFQPPPADLRLSRVQRQTDGEIYYKISSGRAPMPAFKPGLSDDDRWKLVSYIRTLRE